ncbi:SPDL1 [Bugula neritina]|uniref:SPDL1 n=1 Tax=Bugula neritina TaxID=10212 RepID=A0A7J7K5Z6_BUGNE|nr:SPDL1 [Bugula neritina]
MASSCSSSSSSLCDVESLRARLEEKDQILRTSAQYGKDLLDQNRELAQSIDDTTRKFTRQLEILKEENYSVTQRLEHKERMEMEYQDEIETLKKHLGSQRDEMKVLNELRDQSQLISELRYRIRELESLLDKSNLDNKHLTSVVDSHKTQLEEVNSRLSAVQEGKTDTEEVGELLKELQSIKSERDESNSNCISQQSQIDHLTHQLESYIQQISSLEEELTYANSQLSNMSNSFMATTQENQELRCEIDMLRMNDRDHKQKGNSMFTELDDKRQEAEKKLLLLNVKYESLVNQYDLGKKQISKLKLQMSNIIRMASGQVDSNHVTELENQLTEARNEIRYLTLKLSTDEVKSVAHPLKSSSAVQETDYKTVQFVESLLLTKDAELKAMKKELDERRLASTYNTQQLNDVQHKLRNIESKANQLHAQNIQLSVKLEDFKAKYEGDSRSDTRLERGRVEDIPNFDSSTANALLGADSQQGSASWQAVPQPVGETEERDEHSSDVSLPTSSDQPDGVLSENAKFYDNSQTNAAAVKKVINTKSSEQDANSCPTQ